MGKLLAGVILVGMVIAVVMLWPRGDPASPATTTAVAVEASTTVTKTTSTTAPEVSTTELAGSHVVTTVDEAEEILRELWFGWFEGIYNQDEDRIREVVATTHQFDLAIGQFGQMEFERSPEPEDLQFPSINILRTDDECLVISATTSISGFTVAGTSDVHVLRWTTDAWGIFSLWEHPDDLWDADCGAQLS